MAEINNGRKGAAQLAVRLEVQRPEPRQGWIERNHVGMNSDLGLLWVYVTYEVGEREIFGHEVLVHSEDLRDFAEGVRGLLAGKVNEVRLGPASPELGLTLQRCLGAANEPVTQITCDENLTVNLLVYVDTGIAAGGSGVYEAGPAMLLELHGPAVRQFGRDLRSETELVLCL